MLCLWIFLKIKSFGRYKLFYKCCKTSEVDFIKVGRTAQIGEIALFICALRLRHTITPVKSFSEVWRAAQAQLYEIDPRLLDCFNLTTGTQTII